MHTQCRSRALECLWPTLLLAWVLSGAAQAQSAVADPALTPADIEGALGDELLDDLSLEQLLDVVVTATKTEESIYESPAIVTVIRRDEIQAWGYASTAEVLQHAVGFYLIDDHMLPNLGVRGTTGGLRAESGIIKVMIDGRSVAFRSTAGNWLGAELIPLAAVERIEIVRGAASALYGADAFMGVVNIITRQGAKLDGADLRFGGSAIGTGLGADQDLAVGTRQGPFELLLATRLHSEDRSGMVLPESSPHPVVPAYSAENLLATGMRRSSATGLLKLAYHFSEDTRLVLTGHVAAIDAPGEFADWLQLGHGVDAKGRFSENRLSLAQGMLNLHFNTRLFDEIDLNAEAMYFMGGVTPNDRIDTGSDIFYVRRELGYRGVDLEATGTWRYQDSLTVLASLGLVWDDEDLPSVLRVLKTRTGDGAAGEVYEATSTRQGRVNFVNPGATAQVIWKPYSELLSLVGGMRYDFHNIYGNQVSGRLGVVSTLHEDFHLKLIAANAFKAPSPLQLYAVPYRAGDLIGNPDLQAQRVYSLEAQIIYEIGRSVVFSGQAAYNLLQQIAEFTPQGVNQVARNVAEVHALSVETELLLRHEDWLHGYANLALNATTRHSGEEGYRADLVGTANVLYPPVIANTGLRYKVHHVPARLGVELSWIGARRASATNILENLGDYRLDPYLMLGATLSTVGLKLFDADKETTVSLVGRNLLDACGPDPGFGGVDYPLVGRTLLVQLRQEI